MEVTFRRRQCVIKTNQQTDRKTKILSFAKASIILFFNQLKMMLSSSLVVLLMLLLFSFASRKANEELIENRATDEFGSKNYIQITSYTTIYVCIWMKCLETNLLQFGERARDIQKSNPGCVRASLCVYMIRIRNGTERKVCVSVWVLVCRVFMPKINPIQTRRDDTGTGFNFNEWITTEFMSEFAIVFFCFCFCFATDLLWIFKSFSNDQPQSRQNELFQSMSLLFVFNFAHTPKLRF